MDSNDEPVEAVEAQDMKAQGTNGSLVEPSPATTSPDTTAPSEPATRPSGFRRTVLTAGMAAALLIAGGAAVVSAASPDPSASPTPATTTTPSTDGSTTPSSSATPGQGTRANCPHDVTDQATPTTPTG